VQAASIGRVWNQVLRRSDYDSRVAAIEKWNRRNPCYKRGIAVVATKFGLGDPRPERDAAAVLVQILADGSVLVRVGLVDVNDGFRGQIREEVATRLGLEEEAIRVILNDFDVLPRSTPVIGADACGLVLRAIADACKRLQSRLREVALQLFAARGQTEIEIEAIRFVDGLVGPDISPNHPLHFREVIEGAWRKRVNLVETGYHRTPNLWWDHELGAGWPFSAFTYAAAVAEVQIDAFTGEVQILRVDFAHEGSPSPDQGDRDFAQLMRAFTLGSGWLLSESVPYPENDEPSACNVAEGVPGFADAPFQVVTDRLRPLGDPLALPGDPCAEAPVLLAGCVREALWDALRSFGLKPELRIDLPLPSTPPAVLATLREISRQIHERETVAKAAPAAD
jgi:xanthine dehydrogenase large subunit